MPLLSKSQIPSSEAPIYSEQRGAPEQACFDSLPGSWGGLGPGRMWATMPFNLDPWGAIKGEEYGDGGKVSPGLAINPRQNCKIKDSSVGQR